MIKFKRTRALKACIGCYKNIVDDNRFYDGEYWWHRSCMESFVYKMDSLNNKEMKKKCR